MNSYPERPLEIKSLIRIDLPYQKDVLDYSYTRISKHNENM